MTSFLHFGHVNLLSMYGNAEMLLLSAFRSAESYYLLQTERQLVAI